RQIASIASQRLRGLFGLARLAGKYEPRSQKGYAKAKSSPTTVACVRRASRSNVLTTSGRDQFLVWGFKSRGAAAPSRQTAIWIAAFGFLAPDQSTARNQARRLAMRLAGKWSLIRALLTTAEPTAPKVAFAPIACIESTRKESSGDAQFIRPGWPRSCGANL